MERTVDRLEVVECGCGGHCGSDLGLGGLLVDGSMEWRGVSNEPGWYSWCNGGIGFRYII